MCWKLFSSGEGVLIDIVGQLLSTMSVNWSVVFQFLIYDTQQVMGGRKYELSPEEYIYGALQLYIDVVYIFIIILGFMGKSN